MTDQGIVVAKQAGISIVQAFSHGMKTAIAILVDTADSRSLEVFPTSYLIGSLSQSRQFAVREKRLAGVIEYRNTAQNGTAYLVNNPVIASIDSNGLLQPLAEGTTFVTVINGGQIFDVPLTVRLPTSMSQVDDQGGIVANQGYSIAIGPGGLPSGTTLRVDPLSTSTLPCRFRRAGAP